MNNNERIKELEKQIKEKKKVSIEECKFCGFSDEVQSVLDLTLERVTREEVGNEFAELIYKWVDTRYKLFEVSDIEELKVLISGGQRK